MASLPRLTTGYGRSWYAIGEHFPYEQRDESVERGRARSRTPPPPLRGDSCSSARSMIDECMQRANYERSQSRGSTYAPPSPFVAASPYYGDYDRMRRASGTPLLCSQDEGTHIFPNKIRNKWREPSPIRPVRHVPDRVDNTISCNNLDMNTGKLCDWSFSSFDEYLYHVDKEHTSRFCLHVNTTTGLACTEILWGPRSWDEHTASHSAKHWICRNLCSSTGHACNASFSTLYGLERHCEDLHLAEAVEWYCPLCPDDTRAFGHSDQLSRHLRYRHGHRHHGRRSPERCSHTFDERGGLNPCERAKEIEQTLDPALMSTARDDGVASSVLIDSQDVVTSAEDTQHSSDDVTMAEHDGEARPGQSSTHDLPDATARDLKNTAPRQSTAGAPISEQTAHAANEAAYPRSPRPSAPPRRRHTCSVCGKTFTRSTLRNKHLTTHSNDRPFVCTTDGCTQTFKHQNERTRHQTSQHGSKQFVCGGCSEDRVSWGCGKAFARLDGLKDHHAKTSVGAECLRAKQAAESRRDLGGDG